MKLPHEEEQQTVALALQGDQQAKQTLVDLMAPTVSVVIRAYGRNCRTPSDDLKQAAALAILESFPRYDPTRGTRFSTYCFWAVLRGVVDEIQRDSLVRVPRRWSRDGRRILSDSLEDHHDTGDHFDVLKDTILAETAEVLERAMAGLANRDREVLVLKFGLGGGRCRKTVEIAEYLGVTPQRVSQIVARGLAKIASKIKR